VRKSKSLAAAEQMDGCFSPVSYNAIGDPYTGPVKEGRELAKGKKFVLGARAKRGQTGATFSRMGPDGPTSVRAFKRLSENDKYVKPGHQDAIVRLDGVSKFIKPSGFKYASPMKQSCSSGDYAGTFNLGAEGQLGAPHEHFADGTYPTRGVRSRIEELLEGKNVLTSPSKKGGYGVVGVLLGGLELEASSDDFDAGRKKAKAELAAHRAAVGDRKGFKGNAAPLDFFDTMEHVAASKVYSWDDQCKLRPPPPEDALPPKERVEAMADGVLKEDFKAFKPNGIMKTGQQACINKFPPYSSDPFDEHAAAALTETQRNLPVAKWDMDETLKERKAFKPNGKGKSKLTKGVVLNGINSQTVGSMVQQ